MSAQGLTRWLLLTALFVSLAAAAEDVGSPPRLFEFEIEDQFRVKHDQTEFAGHIVLLIGSDGEGSEFNEAWGNALAEPFLDDPRFRQVKPLAVADLRGVPFFMKGYVRGLMPEEKAEYVLTDWKGEFARAYSFVKGSTNILIFAPDGELVSQVAGREPDMPTVTALREVLRAMMDATPVAAPARETP